MSIDPLGQFEVHRALPIGAGSALDLSVTNIAFFTIAVAALIVGFLMFAMRRAAIVPGPLQSIAESLYEFVAGMIRDIIGPEGMRFFPFVFTLFIFVLICNLLGMLVIFPTVTSQLAVTFTLAIISISVVILYGLYKHGLGFFKLFAPSGLPLPMYLIITPIEIISFVSRPFTLAIRLFVNMLAGHVLLKLFAGFVGMLGAAGIVGVVGALIPLFAAFFVTGLEFLVAFLQAYVFAILTVVYLNDVVNLHDH